MYNTKICISFKICPVPPIYTKLLQFDLGRQLNYQYDLFLVCWDFDGRKFMVMNHCALVTRTQ